METIRVAGAQINLRVGDLAHNEARIRDAMSWAEAEGADVLLLPELAIPGYPPEDLVIRKGFVDANLGVLERLAGHAGSTVTVVGFVDRVPPAGPVTTGRDSSPVANAAALLHRGQIK